MPIAQVRLRSANVGSMRQAAMQLAFRTGARRLRANCSHTRSMSASVRLCPLGRLMPALRNLDRQPDSAPARLSNIGKVLTGKKNGRESMPRSFRPAITSSRPTPSRSPKHDRRHPVDVAGPGALDVQRQLATPPSRSRYQRKISRRLATISSIRSSCARPMAACRFDILYL